jgi:hypothetical protein
MGGHLRRRHQGRRQRRARVFSCGVVARWRARAWRTVVPLELWSRRDAQRTKPSRELRRCCVVPPEVWMGGWRWIGEGVAGRGGCQHPRHREANRPPRSHCQAVLPQRCLPPCDPPLTSPADGAMAALVRAMSGPAARRWWPMQTKGAAYSAATRCTRGPGAVEHHLLRVPADAHDAA